jgi:type IV pilus assembly protein PilZ
MSASPLNRAVDAVDLRRFRRTALVLPVVFTVRDSWETFDGIARDISLGGMFIESPSAPSFGAAILVRAALPGRREQLLLPGIVRWRGHKGAGIQFGLLGARETHAITQIEQIEQIERARLAGSPSPLPDAAMSPDDEEENRPTLVQGVGRTDSARDISGSTT